ncbi:MAG: hypothetical protein U0703_11640 [Anaerolineae bacterium]
MLDGQPRTPAYFAQMKRVNREGAALLDGLEAPQPMEGFILAAILKSDAGDGAHVPARCTSRLTISSAPTSAGLSITPPPPT